MAPLTHLATTQSKLIYPTRQQIAVDLSKLDLMALKRYKKHYKLRTRHKTSRKADLVAAVSRHFAAQSVDEAETIERFVFALKTRT